MKLTHSTSMRAAMLGALILTLSLISSNMRADAPIPGDSGTCNGATVLVPFTDVGSNMFFCSIAEAYFSGLTFGTKPVQYSPAALVPRDQMSAFVTRTLDQSVKRTIRRTAMRQTWNPQTPDNLGLTTLSFGPNLVESDGADLWVAAGGAGGRVFRVRASDGRQLESWTGTDFASGVLVAMGKVFVTGATSPNGTLYQIDPTQPAGLVFTLATTLGNTPFGISFDGQRIWTANNGVSPSTGSVSIISLNPFTVTNVTTGFSRPIGIMFDGSNIWMTDQGDNTLKKLDSSGNILTSINLSGTPALPGFDGANIWVPVFSPPSVVVVRAGGQLAGTVLATLTGNGLNDPRQVAFDGERILVTNKNGNSVSLWRATDLGPIGNFSTGANTGPFGACSDGVNFWLTLQDFGGVKLARY